MYLVNCWIWFSFSNLFQSFPFLYGFTLILVTANKKVITTMIRNEDILYRYHDSVDCYGISLTYMATDMSSFLRLWNTDCDIMDVIREIGTSYLLLVWLKEVRSDFSLVLSESIKVSLILCYWKNTDHFNLTETCQLRSDQCLFRTVYR